MLLMHLFFTPTENRWMHSSFNFPSLLMEFADISGKIIVVIITVYAFFAPPTSGSCKGAHFN